MQHLLCICVYILRKKCYFDTNYDHLQLHGCMLFLEICDKYRYVITQ